MIRSCRGHCLPRLVGPRGQVASLDGVRGKPLGIREGFDYESVARKLMPGEGLFLFTDGVTEAMDPSGELFGEERLLAALTSRAEQAPSDLVAGVLHDVREFAGTADPSDDIAALACRWRA